MLLGIPLSFNLYRRFTMRLWDRIRDFVFLAVLLLTSLTVLLGVQYEAFLSLRSASLEFTSRVESAFAWVGRYVNALNENDQLRANNLRLSSRLARLLEEEIENQRLRGLLNLKSKWAEYPRVAAQIVSRDVTKSNNLLTINVGSNQGIEKGMPVISDRGLIGRVVLVSRNYSVVMPYLNTTFKAAAKIQPQQIYGIIRWEGNRPDRLLLDHVVKTEKVSKGDTIVTAGYTHGFYPAGIPIGYVDSTAVRKGQNDWLIYVRPMVMISQTEHAFVLLFKPDIEQTRLLQKADSLLQTN